RMVTEDSYDGGVIEFSTDSGASWSTYAPVFNIGGYNGLISSVLGNPLAGRSAWTGTIGSPGNFEQVQVNLLSYAGLPHLRFRFREGTDVSFGATGWWIDDVVVSIAPPCGPT